MEIKIAKTLNPPKIQGVVSVEPTQEKLKSGLRAAKGTVSPQSSPIQAEIIVAEADLLAVANSENSLAAITYPVLTLLQNSLGYEAAYLSYVKATEKTFKILFCNNSPNLRIPENLNLDWNDSFTCQAIESDVAQSHKLGADFPTSKFVKDYNVRSFISFPITTADGKVFGTLCGLSTKQIQITPGSVALIKILSRVISDEISREAYTPGKEEYILKLTEDAQKLSALDYAKSESMRLTSHELRGPLTIVRGYLSLFEDGSLGPLTPSMSKIIPLLSKKMDEMNGLVEEMLEAARLEDSRLQLHLQEVNLAELLDNIISSIQSSTSIHEVVFNSPKEEIRVNIDTTRITVAVANLINNAIKYSPDGGKIECSLKVKDNMAYFKVKDSGIGIAEDDLPKLFNKFSRVVDETLHIPGTGLGLYLSRELIRLHQGDIKVESVLGKGSTFILSLPKIN